MESHDAERPLMYPKQPEVVLSPAEKKAKREAEYLATYEQSLETSKMYAGIAAGLPDGEQRKLCLRYVASYRQVSDRYFKLYMESVMEDESIWT